MKVRLQKWREKNWSGWICSLPPDPSSHVEAGSFMVDIMNWLITTQCLS